MLVKSQQLTVSSDDVPYQFQAYRTRDKFLLNTHYKIAVIYSAVRHYALFKGSDPDEIRVQFVDPELESYLVRIRIKEV
jgi:hypothetical protein